MASLRPLNVLLVEDNDEHAHIISRYISGKDNDSKVALARAERLKTALHQLQEATFDAILLDLRLPDSDIDETLPQMLAASSHIPIIVLSTLEDRDLAIRTVHEGAQDYLCKSDLSTDLLIRVVYSAIERKQNEIKLKRQVQRNQNLFQFSQFGIGEIDAGLAIGKMRQLLTQALDVEGADYISRESLSADDDFLSSALWHTMTPVPLDRESIIESLPQGAEWIAKGFVTALAMAIPGRQKLQSYGLILLFSKVPRIFEEDELSFVHAVANTLSMAINRHDLQKELQTRVGELDAAHRRKDDFLATLSHELRTPLNVIKGYVEILKDKSTTSQEFHEALGAIERNVLIEIQLVADTLEVSRITTGKMRLSLQEVRLDNIFKLALDSIAMAALAKQIQVTTELPSEPVVFSGDPDRLLQVLWNLLTNAVKFTPKDGKVSLVGRRVGSLVEVSVQDNGQGIDGSNLPYVFEKFWQEDSAINRRHMGLGLGLSIVRHIVELHGGTVRVYSKGRNQGTCFTLQIPLRQLAVAAQKPVNNVSPSEPVSAPQVMGQDLSGLKILVVDDSEDTLALIKRLLQKRGAHIKDTSVPQTALSEAQTHEYDILVSDIGMPEIDGYELMRRLRVWEKGKGRHLPAIALTAYASNDDIQRAKEAGFEMHMSKPVNIRELESNILRLTEERNESEKPVRGDMSPPIETFGGNSA
ncbi:MAG: response regulator [Bdellovibrio sp.]